MINFSVVQLISDQEVSNFGTSQFICEVMTKVCGISLIIIINYR